MVDGSPTLDTVVKVTSQFVNCELDVELTVLGGSACTQDAGGGNSYFIVESMSFADVPPQSCGIAMLGLDNVVLTGAGSGMDVTIPATGGAMTGNQPVVLDGDAKGSAIGMPIDAPLEGFEGTLPEGSVAVGAGIGVSYDDTTHVLATGMPEVSGMMLTVEIIGLQGTVNINP